VTVKNIYDFKFWGFFVFYLLLFLIILSVYFKMLDKNWFIFVAVGLFCIGVFLICTHDRLQKICKTKKTNPN